jgi:TetR/AcrR family transcriptional repressor of nem operon
LSRIALEGIKKRQIDHRVAPRQLAQLIIGSLEGALLISRLQKDEQPLRAMRQHLDDYLEESVRAKREPKH